MGRRTYAAPPVFDRTPYVGQVPRPARPAGPVPAGQKNRTAERTSGSGSPEPVPQQRGPAGPNSGRTPRLPAVPVFRGSTGQVQGLYPWLYGASMPAAGAYDIDRWCFVQLREAMNAPIPASAPPSLVEIPIEEPVLVSQ